MPRRVLPNATSSGRGGLAKSAGAHICKAASAACHNPPAAAFTAALHGFLRKHEKEAAEVAGADAEEGAASEPAGALSGHLPSCTVPALHPCCVQHVALACELRRHRRVSQPTLLNCCCCRRAAGHGF